MRNHIGTFMTVLGSTLLSSAAFAGGAITYQGRILDPSNNPVEAANVTFKIQIRSPGAQSCLLYEETRSLSMSNSAGMFAISIGDGNGTRTASDPGIPIDSVFSNNNLLNHTGLNCNTGSAYSPSALDSRRLFVTFNDGSGAEQLPPIEINHVPLSLQAMEAENAMKIGSTPASQVLTVSSGTATPLSPAQFAELLSVSNGSSSQYVKASSLPSCAAGEVAKVVAGVWSCVTVSDSLAVMACADGKILKRVAGAWACADESGVGTEVDPTVAAYAKQAPGAGLVVNGSSQIVADFGTTAGKIVQGNDSRLTDSRAPTGAAGGDLSNTYPNPKVVKIQGVDVDSATPVAGQFMKHDGSKWAPGAITLADLKSTNSGPLFSAPNCASNQTLSWSSISDQFSCISISLNANAITAGTMDIARLPVGTAAGTVAAGNDPRFTDARAPTAHHHNVDEIDSAAGKYLTYKPNNVQCADGEVLKWINANQRWECAQDAGAAGTVASVTVNAPITNSGTATNMNLSISAASTSAAGIVQLASSGGTTAGQAVQANDPRLNDSRAPNGAAGGDLAGNFPSPTLAPVGTAGTYAKVTTDSKGRVTSGSTTIDYGDVVNAAGKYLNYKPNNAACADTDLLKWDDTNSRWVCQPQASLTASNSANFTGSLVGDVTGTQGATVVATVGTSTAANVHAAELLANAATSANTNSAIVKRDSSGNFAASNITHNLSIFKDSGANTVTVQAPSSVSASYTLKLPTAAPSGTQLLQVDASGNMSYTSGNAGTVTGVTASAPLSSSGGTAPNITIGKADGSTNGYLSSGDWTTFNNKMAATLNDAKIWVGVGTTPAERSLSGDVSMLNTGAVTVSKIQNRNVAATAPAAGQVYRWDGTSSFNPAYIGVADIRSTQAGNAAMFPSCGVGQVMTYSSGTDTYVCSNINMNASQITAGIVAVGNLGSGSADSSKFLRGDGSWATPPTGGSSATWTTLTSNTTLTVNSNYMVNGSSRLMMTLPTTCAVGDTLKIVSTSAYGFQLGIPSGVTVKQGSTAVDSSATVMVDSSGATLDFVCSTANTQWTQLSAVGAASISAKWGIGLSRLATCIITGPTKELRCWGYNGYGTLGYGDTTNRCNAANAGTTCVSNLPPVNLGAGRTAKKIVHAEMMACAIMDNDQMKCWGYNGNGQLGYGDTTQRCQTGGTSCVAGLPQLDFGAGRSVRDVVMGNQTVCALLDNSTMKCWGYNGYGGLGVGDTTNRCHTGGTTCLQSLPAIDFGAGRTVLKMAIGSIHTCAILDNGTVKCWGYNGHGQVGQGDTASKCNAGGTTCTSTMAASYLPAGRTAKDITADYYATCVIMDNNQVLCWGYNGNGGLGVGDTAYRCNTGGAACTGAVPTQVNLGTGRSAKSVVMAHTGTCVLMDNDQVKCFGYNGQGQMGVGTTTSVCTSGGTTCVANNAALDFGSGRWVKSIYAPTDYNANGSYFFCALLDNDQIKCWGYNNYNQLGVGDTTNRCDTGGTTCLSNINYIVSDGSTSTPGLSIYGGGTYDALPAYNSYTCSSWGGGSCNGSTFVCGKGSRQVTGSSTYVYGCYGGTVTYYLCLQ